jgi:hypothetical protein
MYGVNERNSLMFATGVKRREFAHAVKTLNEGRPQGQDSLQGLLLFPNPTYENIRFCIKLRLLGEHNVLPQIQRIDNFATLHHFFESTLEAVACRVFSRDSYLGHHYD